VSAADAVVEAWLAALIERHTSNLSRPEFLKAVRALSVRYVERRAALADRTPTDSPGKRAAFAGFFAAVHFITVRAVVGAVGAAVAPLDQLVDLGCGTGVAGAAWALACRRRPPLVGVDRQRWALQEAEWNWRMLGLRGRTRVADFVTTAEAMAKDRRTPGRTGLVLAWSVNELDAGRRQRLLAAVHTLASRHVAVLVIEPIARAATPWWGDWWRAVTAGGGQAAEWRFDVALPGSLAALDEAAGFRRDGLAVRTLWLPGELPVNR
jgi:hypothetical protein